MSELEREADAVIGVRSDVFDDLDRGCSRRETPRFAQRLAGVDLIERKDYAPNYVRLCTLIDIW
jgi:hypothetical protein